MLNTSTLQYTERLTAAYRGLDTLHRAANPDDPWGIVVLDLGTSPDVESFKDWRSARATFTRLHEEAANLDEADRSIYYHDLTRSALTVIEWNERNGNLPLEAQVAGFLATEPRPASEDELEETRQHLADALSTAGYSGELRQAAAAWEADNRVAPADLIPIMHDLIAEATERTASIVDITLPPAPTVELVSNAQFNARCDFANNNIQLNQDPVLTRADLKHLVVHEVFPGHCLQFSARRQAHAEGWGGADGLLSLVKSAGSPLFEGLADSGGDFIGWNAPEDQIIMYVARLRAGIGTVAAWGLHREGWSLDQARSYLSEHALVGGPGWVANRLGYISPHGRGAHVWSYWLGEQHLRAALAQRNAPLDHGFLRTLYGRMHSLASLKALTAEKDA